MTREVGMMVWTQRVNPGMSSRDDWPAGVLRSHGAVNLGAGREAKPAAITQMGHFQCVRLTLRFSE
jgi:hypothetical protein